ncbi:2-keto-4-pentenoate hydratase/2-oxohepta-3-ene-1,7-dioic acid hydratase in catechol pathway [Microbacteriaceae bacterium SG_E_30_P1]|uniref:2-keto-4-pentenoate hydratase/2-oxohepta-3-ene-1,7-dioic acid hydratase in catechol pathway n=1 Tax=Antiquaquibacter oligotrophicus TaxID=2880260 RepID=A0ABT6KPW5_9MICO|nr:fumarylacetoacetate hydrolase family protein [Antiquaquibacter oligotrophicus]MDH6181523.1 2-keto-4-pentenoate hydratase/2-oxohepta-3-ene-1,7-dioic acid hydratase in catechol pathway [Antiquaquibacter oligotrophicus]UDF12787.1 fumarylacetoacetate hydrolase family protein [Antiquaquibacter oligotrophicus]
MKIARFSHEGDIRFGIIDDDEVVVLANDPMFAGYETLDERLPLSEVKLIAPVIPRSKVIAFGRNYRDHATELGNEVPAEPLMFLKPNTSVIGPGDTIVLPPQSENVAFEGELAVVIGAIAKNVSAEKAESVIFGFTIANDVTARDLQTRDGQWSRAKGFDTFCPIGPVIETEFAVIRQHIVTRVNGDVKQDGPVSDMLHGVAELIEYASSVFTLLPGDLLLTGTPAGVGPLVSGDTVDVTIEGIGTLSNPVR